MGAVTTVVAQLRRIAFCFWLLTPLAAYAGGGCTAFTLDGPSKVDFDNDIQPIFDRVCVSCHSPGADGFEALGLDLRPGQSQRSLVNIPSPQDPSWMRVVPFDDGRGVLYHAVRCVDSPVGGRMPPPGSEPLTEREIKAIRSWIIRGAPPGRAGNGRVLPIQVAVAGSWHDPSATGQGFVFEVVPAKSREEKSLLVAYWLTQADDRSTATPQERQRWFVALGGFSEGESSVTLDVKQVTGGTFDDYTVMRNAPSIGTALLQFHDCNEATLHYALEFGEPPLPAQRGIALRRLTPNVSCAQTDAQR